MKVGIGRFGVLGPFALTLAGCVSAGDLGATSAAGSRAAQEQAKAAEYRALEFGRPGNPISWRYGNSFGTVTPGPYFTRGSYRRCREVTYAVCVDGRPKITRSASCRQPNGSWRPLR
jgi:surface antigen